MSQISIPNNYPEGCSDDLIKDLIVKFQKEIVINNSKKNKVLSHIDYPILIEHGSAELNLRLNQRLISNLEKSSKRQRELTWAIVIIGGLNLILAFLKMVNIIKV
ncbi:hypothetical protein D1816_12390 [Aquimarina sp. AD10]|uniref:hypothetical protein n=1 Tax=Aquimarina sp. AD10 TaxID=1714849 RepID=UPI000E516F20|nr:hypothetical protein [Aquimarina sp. AD10]AXT61113.1 hypothetical protein D1816_12390 [Aquimarina sp. AD10]RKM92168.1 hypothetical protein D7033_21375 [Aquimarina sp. AD10]